MIATASPGEVLATLPPEDAADSVWNTIVVGGGPAGAAVAIRLARGGRRVLLIDRQSMPRPKVCGCCLSATAMAELRKLGCRPNARGRLLGAVPLERVRVVASTRGVTLPMPPGGTLSRESLDSQLVQMASDAGAAWLPQVDVTGVAENPGPKPTVTIACRPQTGSHAGRAFLLRAEAAVIATGLADHVRVPGDDSRSIEPGSRIGVGTTLAPGMIDLPAGELLMAVGRGGYCGIVTLENGRIDVAAAIDRKRIAATGSMSCAVADIVQEAAGHASWTTPVSDALASATYLATPPLTRSAAAVAGITGRILRVGDAAGYVEPFTGEGMGWALAGGRLAADAMLTSLTPAAAYRQSFAAFARRHHRRCRRISAVLRQPLLVSSAIRVAAAAPWIAAPLVPMLVGCRSAVEAPT